LSPHGCKYRHIHRIANGLIDLPLTIGATADGIQATGAVGAE
jgi:hypothetical protein